MISGYSPSRIQGLSLIGPSGMMRAEEYCLLEYKSQIEEMVLSMGSGLVSLPMKVMLLGQSFAISKN